MSLTSNFDFCVELGIAQVKEIFHLAFKTEDRYPHNIGPLPRNFSGTDMNIYVRVHDDDDRPSDLSFQDDRHILFSFPFDLTAEIPDAPDPSLSRVTLQARVNIPGSLESWNEAGADVLGLSFYNIVKSDVKIVEMTGLPVITADNFLSAIHSKYDHIFHIYSDPSSGSTLLLYDGSRDLSLDPPNLASPAEIQAALETHSGQEYLKVTAPIYISVPIPGGGSFTSYGHATFFRKVTRSDYAITLDMSSEPLDPALATQVQLDTSAGAGAELTGILNDIHTQYTLQPSHVYTLAGNTLVVYDDNLDPTLIPPKAPANAASPADIQAAFETHSGVEYLKISIPINADVPTAFSFNSYGHINLWRAVTRDHTAHTLSVNMATEPAAATGLQTTIDFDTSHPAKAIVAASLQPLAVSAMGGFDTPSGPSSEAVSAGLTERVIAAVNNYGVIVEPAFSDAGARDTLQNEILNYMKARRYPVFTPQSGDESEPLSTPVGFLLVDVGVLAVLMNRRTGGSGDDYAPDNFLGTNQVALAVGIDKVYDYITKGVKETFPGLDGSNGSYSGSSDINTKDGSATLKNLTVNPSDAGQNGQSVGHLWVTGSAEVHIDCWPDPTANFDGPIYISASRVDDENGCGLDIVTSAGDFDIDQSCCDVFIDLIIPIIGWIVLAVVESTINSVGGELAAEIAAGQGRQIKPIPPVVNGIAQVNCCLTGLSVSSQGFVLPGVVEIRRLGTSFDDLKDGNDLPKP